MDEHRADLHEAGLHIMCRPALLWSGVRRIGDGTWRRCPLAGKMERFHSHEFDGPLICGCPEG